MDPRIFPPQIVEVVGGDHPHPQFLGEAHQFAVEFLLSLQPLVLQFQEEPVRAKDLPVPGGGLPRRPGVFRQEVPGDFPAQTGREGDQPLGISGQYLPVHPRAVIKPFHMADGGEFQEVFVTLFILRQQHQVVRAFVNLGRAVMPRPPGHINLAAQDGLDPRRLGGLVEF